MGDLIRTIIRWIIIILIVILIIFLLFKITDKSKTKKAVNTGVQTVKKTKDKVKETVKDTVNEVTADPEGSEDENVTGDDAKVEDEDRTLVVDTPDTDTSSAVGLIGVIILSGGAYYVYRRREAN